MDEVSRSGRTVLFVSHNMAAIEGLCTSAAFIMQGRVIYSGTPRRAIESYERRMARSESALVDLRDHPNRDKSSEKIMLSARLCDACGAVTNIFPLKGTIVLSVWFSSPTPFKPVLGIVVRTASGIPVFGADNRLYSRYLPDREYSKGVISCKLGNVPLAPGTYFCDLYIGNQWHSLDRIMRAISFEIRAADVLHSGKLPYAHCGYVIHDDILWWVAEADEPT
jgi:lipopolysaccharide transport system ATP-binding protein